VTWSQRVDLRQKLKLPAGASEWSPARLCPFRRSRPPSRMEPMAA
jgi:hypothetical protein